MRKLMAVAAGLMLAATACSGGAAPTTILVDYSHDEFASFVAENFPREVSVHPGAELVFKQTWTGEPHSVTGGTLTNELMTLVEPYILKSLRGEEIPEDAPKPIAKLEKQLPKSYYDEEAGDDQDFNQSAAVPCYLEDKDPPTDGEPCKAADREQPVFTGKQRFYNSGLIPYEGAQGNEYRVQLADDISPGAYWFYCNVHGEFQSTKVVVKRPSERVDSAAEISRRAREQIDSALDPVLKVYQRAAKDHELQLDPKDEDSIVKGDFAGLFDSSSMSWHSINEFVPRRMTVQAGEDITWNMFGYHTISFGVPKYFPVLTFEKDGSVKRNPKLDPAAGGAKTQEQPDFDPERHEPIRFDGGTYDGSGFWSSGAIAGDPYVEYTMRISEPGTYRYACLVHPPMVGTVVVK
jgi:plastocyanin